MIGDMSRELPKPFVDSSRRMGGGEGTSRARLKLSVAILIGVGLSGTLAFYYVGEGRSLLDSIYMTTNILTTVGDPQASRTYSEHERIVALLLMILGVSAVLYAASTLFTFLVEGELRHVLGRRQLQHKISHMSDHYIVCGYGRMGRALCDSLSRHGSSFILIESDQAAIERADKDGVLYLLGDATDEQVLTDARIDRAKGLASCLPTDADNIFVSLSARSLNETIHIISRAEDTRTEPKLRRAGADRVICTPVLGANQVVRMLLHPAVDELFELAMRESDLEVTKTSIDEMPQAAEKSLRELSLPKCAGVMVVAVIDANGQVAFNPNADRRLAAGEFLLVIGPPGGVEKMTALLGGQ